MSSQDQSTGKKVIGQGKDSNMNGAVDTHLDLSSSCKNDKEKEMNENSKEVLEMGNLVEKPEIVPKEEPPAREADSMASSLRKVGCCIESGEGVYFETCIDCSVFIGGEKRFLKFAMYSCILEFTAHFSGP